MYYLLITARPPFERLRPKSMYVCKYVFFRSAGWRLLLEPGGNLQGMNHNSFLLLGAWAALGGRWYWYLHRLPAAFRPD